MIISLAILTGFQQGIRDKVIGLGSHIQIVGFDFNNSYESSPVDMNQTFYPYQNDKPGIRHIQVFANKAGIIKTEEHIQGIILKGVGADYDWTFFKNNIIEGTYFEAGGSEKSDDVIISRKLSDKLNINIGDDIRAYFISGGQQQPRGRKFSVTGIYETGLEEIDNLYLIGDIRHIQKLNNWNENQVAGFEVLINDFETIDQVAEEIHEDIPYDLRAVSIKDLYPQIFSWLELQDMNVIVIIVLMVLVAGITMISTLLVLILERTNMIGILKALGARDWSVRKIFLYNAAYIILTGLIWGNLIGIGLSMLQYYFGLIPLSQESYYLSVVPINLSFSNILILNLGTLLICTLILVIPSYVVTRITPLKAIRFD